MSVHVHLAAAFPQISQAAARLASNPRSPEALGAWRAALLAAYLDARNNIRLDLGVPSCSESQRVAASPQAEEATMLPV